MFSPKWYLGKIGSRRMLLPNAMWVPNWVVPHNGLFFGYLLHLNFSMCTQKEKERTKNEKVLGPHEVLRKSKYEGNATFGSLCTPLTIRISTSRGSYILFLFVFVFLFRYKMNAFYCKGTKIEPPRWDPHNGI